jgi:hypothetical protein
MSNHIIITESHANVIRGSYGKYSEIDPVPIPDGNFIIPERCLSDADLAEAKAKIESASGEVQDIIDLPDSGTIEKDRIYKYNGQLVKAVREHQRTIYAPEQTPDLFSFFRENSDDLEWIPNEMVEPGWKRMYNGEQWEFIGASKTLTIVGQTPDLVPSIWSKVVDPNTIEPWHPFDGTASSLYQTGMKCTFNGHIWESKIDNNSWSPSAYLDGWNDLGLM